MSETSWCQRLVLWSRFGRVLAGRRARCDWAISASYDKLKKVRYHDDACKSNTRTGNRSTHPAIATGEIPRRAEHACKRRFRPRTAPTRSLSMASAVRPRTASIALLLLATGADAFSTAPKLIGFHPKAATCSSTITCARPAVPASAVRFNAENLLLRDSSIRPSRSSPACCARPHSRCFSSPARPSARPPARRSWPHRPFPVALSKTPLR